MGIPYIMAADSSEGPFSLTLPISVCFSNWEQTGKLPPCFLYRWTLLGGICSNKARPMEGVLSPIQVANVNGVILLLISKWLLGVRGGEGELGYSSKYHLPSCIEWQGNIVA